MQIFIPKETNDRETRVPIIPAIADKLVKLGAEVIVETGLGSSIQASDADYTKVGAQITKDAKSALGAADMVLRLNKPSRGDIKHLKRGAVHISYLDPFNDPDTVRDLALAGISAISMEMIPRTTLAQKMDALSSQANLAGYVAVMIAANRLSKVLPMMMTPAGTLTPSRVFIIGAGVAGLQAIATAKRLGARVEAFDTRPVVAEQVQSLGAKFLKIDLGETGQTKDGYARELTPEQLQKQRDAMAKAIAAADVVITTAQVFGKKAPRIITDEMIKGMTRGSVIIDMAVDSGGNVEGSRPGEDVVIHGVLVVGTSNLPGQVPAHASQMYASNLYNLIEHFWDKEQKTFKLNRDDEIIQGCLLTHDGAVVRELG